MKNKNKNIDWKMQVSDKFFSRFKILLGKLKLMASKTKRKKSALHIQWKFHIVFYKSIEGTEFIVMQNFYIFKFFDKRTENYQPLFKPVQYCDVNFQFTCDLTFIHGISCSQFVSALLETQYLPTHSKIGNSIFFSITSIFTEASKL